MPTPRPRPRQNPPAPPLSDLLRGPLQALGQLTGIETAARSVERLATSAERAAEVLERLESEVGIERLVNVLERLERLSETADQMNRSLRALEKLALEMQKRVFEPFDRLPIPRALRGMGGGNTKQPKA